MQNSQEDKKQDNMGYENTETRNNEDDKENTQVQTTDTGHNEGPKENKKDSAGLRSESGSKSTGKESGNLEKG